MWPAHSHTAASSVSSPKARVVMLFACYVGTGSTCGASQNDGWSAPAVSGTTFSVPINAQNDAPAQRLDIRSPKEHIENIRKVLDPAISDLAALFGLTRQAIYKWINGTSSPDDTNMARVVALSQIADRFKAEGTSRAHDLVKMKIFSGRSLMDLVKNSEQTDQHLTTLIAEAKAMSDGYQRSGAAESRTRPSDAWKSSISIPSASEQS